MGSGASADLSAAITAANVDEVTAALAKLSPEDRAKVQEATKSLKGADSTSVVVRAADATVVFDGALPGNTKAQGLAEQILKDRSDFYIPPKTKQAMCGTPDEIKLQSENGILEKYKKGYKPSVQFLLGGELVEPSSGLDSLVKGEKSVEMTCTFKWTMEIEEAKFPFEFEGEKREKVLNVAPGPETDFHKFLMKHVNEGFDQYKDEDIVTCTGAKFMEKFMETLPKVSCSEVELVTKLEELAQGSEGKYYMSKSSNSFDRQYFGGYIAGHYVSAGLVNEEEE